MRKELPPGFALPVNNDILTDSPPASNSPTTTQHIASQQHLVPLPPPKDAAGRRGTKPESELNASDATVTADQGALTYLHKPVAFYSNKLTNGMLDFRQAHVR